MPLLIKAFLNWKKTKKKQPQLIFKWWKIFATLDVVMIHPPRSLTSIYYLLTIYFLDDDFVVHEIFDDSILSLLSDFLKKQNHKIIFLWWHLHKLESMTFMITTLGCLIQNKTIIIIIIYSILYMMITLTPLDWALCFDRNYQHWYLKKKKLNYFSLFPSNTN